MKYDIERATIIYMEFNSKADNKRFKDFALANDIQYSRILQIGNNYFQVLVDDENADKITNYIKSL